MEVGTSQVSYVVYTNFRNSQFPKHHKFSLPFGSGKTHSKKVSRVIKSLLLIIWHPRLTKFHKLYLSEISKTTLLFKHYVSGQTMTPS